MSPIEIGLTGLGALLVLIALRVPVGVSLIGVSFIGIWALLGQRAAWGVLKTVPYGFTSSWTLSSVPMFLLMGYFCYHAGLTRGLFDAARAWLSRLPGGIAVAGVFGAGGFAAVSGSSVACAAAMGRIAVPEMLRERYDPGLATGSLAAAGTLGALIPPSILLIIFGIVAQVPISQLFLGGFVVGALTIATYVAMIVVRAALNPALAPRSPRRFTTAEKWRALADTWPVLLLMAGVMGGLFGGVFTPTEAGASGAFLSFVIAASRGALTWQVFRASVMETVLTSASLFIIAIGASMLARFLALTGVGAFLGDLVTAAELPPLAVMLCLVAVYLVLGMFLEPIGAMLLTLPIVLPIVASTGHDLLWFGILLAKVLEIGMITPPIGLNVFVINRAVGNTVALNTIFRGVVWFFVADLVAVALLLAFPQIILFVPALAGG